MPVTTHQKPQLTPFQEHFLALNRSKLATVAAIKTVSGHNVTTSTAFLDIDFTPVIEAGLISKSYLTSRKPLLTIINDKLAKSGSYLTLNDVASNLPGHNVAAVRLSSYAELAAILNHFFYPNEKNPYETSPKRKSEIAATPLSKFTLQKNPAYIKAVLEKHSHVLTPGFKLVDLTTGKPATTESKLTEIDFEALNLWPKTYLYRVRNLRDKGLVRVEDLFNNQTAHLISAGKNMANKSEVLGTIVLVHLKLQNGEKLEDIMNLKPATKLETPEAEKLKDTGLKISH